MCGKRQSVQDRGRVSSAEWCTVPHLHPCQCRVSRLQSAAENTVQQVKLEADGSGTCWHVLASQAKLRLFEESAADLLTVQRSLSIDCACEMQPRMRMLRGSYSSALSSAPPVVVMWARLLVARWYAEVRAASLAGIASDPIGTAEQGSYRLCRQ